MARPYDARAIESAWRARWEAEGINRVDLDAVAADDVFYNLVEFPYPSAEGLHVGHVYRYGGVDTYGRYQRMRGKHVFQPIGFDAFGIHTENYALRVGEHPRPLTARTTARFREQLARIGMAWDWSRTIDTSDASYYRWTQWLLTRLFDAGLMYQAEAPVVWCPSCLTVLAREQTERDGTVCERCGTRVTEKVMTQWFLRTTAYADRLYDGLTGLDWPERARRLQRQWIGRDDDGAMQLHDWLISRQRYWGAPIPIVHCDDCGPVAVPDAELPVVLPDVDDFRPTGTGRSPLAAVEAWVRTTCPRCGGEARRETDVSDTFVDSSWYFLRYPSTEFDDRPWDVERTARVLPVDFYAGGVEHVQRHHLYARFVTMALHDLGLVPFEEPFPRVRLGGLIAKDGAKMSKSRGNVVTPDDYIERHGADALRCALLFSAPWEQGGEFRDDAIVGIERFFARAWRVVTAPDRAPAGTADLSATSDAVAAAIERLSFNVGLARLMEAVRRVDDPVSKRVFVRLLAPFAPHLAEELWHQLDEPFSVHTQPWPTPPNSRDRA
ncbi:MAG TPA: class I tRNA ligase family protein [Ilumatobacteraceae bacterium]|nr:class I tRNA ligase family protein [Ilumatobacteraceae bacterium]